MSIGRYAAQISSLRFFRRESLRQSFLRKEKCTQKQQRRETEEHVHDGVACDNVKRQDSLVPCKSLGLPRRACENVMLPIIQQNMGNRMHSSTFSPSTSCTTVGTQLTESEQLGTHNHEGFVDVGYLSKHQTFIIAAPETPGIAPHSTLLLRSAVEHVRTS